MLYCKFVVILTRVCRINAYLLKHCRVLGAITVKWKRRLAWPTLFLLNVFTALTGTHFIFYLLSLQLVLCRVAALKSGPVHRL